MLDAELEDENAFTLISFVDVLSLAVHGLHTHLEDQSLDFLVSGFFVDDVVVQHLEELSQSVVLLSLDLVHQVEEF